MQFYFSPFLFGIAFLAPLCAQVLDQFDAFTWTTSLVAGGLIGVCFGAMAQIRGSWIWFK